MTWETLLVDGVDVTTIGARVIRSWDDMLTSPRDRGDPLILPGRDGAQDTQRAFDPVVATVGLQLRSDSILTGLNDMLRALRGICKPGQLVTLTRRLSYSSGNETHTAPGRYLSGLTPTLVTPKVARLDVSFTVLSGLWYGAAVTITPGTRTIAGEVRTRRMTLDLPGAGTLTNSTLGVSVTVTAAAVLDVDAETSTGSVLDVASSGDPLDAWFALAPGSNVITWSGSGVPDIDYQPAYL